MILLRLNERAHRPTKARKASECRYCNSPVIMRFNGRFAVAELFGRQAVPATLAETVGNGGVAYHFASHPLVVAGPRNQRRAWRLLGTLRKINTNECFRTFCSGVSGMRAVGGCAAVAVLCCFSGCA